MRIVGIAVALATRLAMAGAAPNAAARQGRSPSAVILQPGHGINGTVSARKRCLSGRMVRVVDVSGGRVVAALRTDNQGRFSIAQSFSGPAYAAIGKQKRAGVRCKGARSEIVNLGIADLQTDLAGPLPGFLSVSNLGPDDARNVVAVVATAGAGFGGSGAIDPPVCSEFLTNLPPADDVDASVRLVCTIGRVPANSTYVIRLHSMCHTTQQFSFSAYSGSDTPDPVLSNNLDLVQGFCP